MFYKLHDRNVMYMLSRRNNFAHRPLMDTIAIIHPHAVFCLNGPNHACQHHCRSFAIVVEKGAGVAEADRGFRERCTPSPSSY